MGLTNWERIYCSGFYRQLPFLTECDGYPRFYIANNIVLGGPFIQRYHLFIKYHVSSSPIQSINDAHPMKRTAYHVLYSFSLSQHIHCKMSFFSHDQGYLGNKQSR